MPDRPGGVPALAVHPGPGRERMGFRRDQDKNGWRFVSLRLSATDSGGNSVTQTITNAYRLR